MSLLAVGASEMQGPAALLLVDVSVLWPIARPVPEPLEQLMLAVIGFSDAWMSAVGGPAGRMLGCQGNQARSDRGSGLGAGTEAAGRTGWSTDWSEG